VNRTLIGLVILGVLSGCSDPKAAKRRQWQKDLEAVSGQIQQIEKGYVPHGLRIKSGQWLDLQTHRQDQIAGLISKLRLLAQQAGPRQKSAAKSLLAEYYASMARQGVRSAITAWGNVSNEGVMLLSQMTSVGQADSRAKSLDTDDTPLLETLEEEKQRCDSKLGEYQKLVDNAQRSDEQLNKQITGHSEQKDQLMQQASDLRKQAFVQKGAEQIAVYKRETDIQIQATGLEKNIQKLKLKRDLVQSSMRIDRQQRDLYRSSSKWLAQQIESIAQQQTQSQGLRDIALHRKNELATTLRTQFAKVQEAYDVQVEKVFGDATAMAEQAVAEIGTPPGDKTNIMLDKLTAQVTLLHVITQHVVTAGSYGQTLDLLARQARRLELQSANLLRMTADSFQQKRRELAVKAEKFAADAHETGRKLEGDRDEQVVKAVTGQRNHIRTYQDRIKATSLVQR